MRRLLTRSWFAGRAHKPALERWSSRGTYVAVAVAAVCGGVLLWRFPALALQFGGGTFLVAYAVALLLIALPLLVLEAGLGQQTQRAAPRSLRLLHKRWEWVGWAGTLVAFVLLCLTVVVAIWGLIYAFGALQALAQMPEALPWDADPAGFLERRLYGELAAGMSWSLPRMPALLTLAGVWGVLGLLVAGGPRLFGEVLRYLLPAAGLLLLVFVARFILFAADPAMGAVHGLDWALHVEAAALGDMELWIAAVAHALLAYSLGLGVHVSLAANLPREADVANNARFVGLIGATATLVVFLAVACLLGILALHDARLVSDLPALFPDRPADGIGVLLLIVPQALVLTDAAADSVSLRAVWAASWFLALAGFALAAAVVLLHTVASAVREKWALARWRIAAALVGLGLLVTVVLLGIVDWRWFDLADYWMVRIAVIALALFECVALGWVIGIRPLRREINRVSEQPVSIWWEVCVRVVAPLALVVLLVNAVSRTLSGL